jgi:hypothetical protein
VTSRSVISVRIAGSLACAALFVALQHPLMVLANNRPGVFPIAMCAMIWGLILPRMRQTIIVALCFGIALIAARSAYFDSVPIYADFVWTETAWPLIWLAISAMTAAAGVQEAIRPGSIPAARCYFAAVMLYMVGGGWLMAMKGDYVEGFVAFSIALLAAIASFNAKRIIGPASPASEPALDDDLRELSRRSAERAATLAAKEWKENGEHPSRAG